MLKREEVKGALGELAKKKIDAEKESLLKKDNSGGFDKLNSQGHGKSESTPEADE